VRRCAGPAERDEGQFWNVAPAHPDRFSYPLRFLDISKPSLQRYASGERTTPQDVAERLHALALIVSDLAGTYNEFGIRRWFERPRAQLGERSPAAMLKRGWTPDEESARRVRALAASLSGAGAT